MFSKLLLSRRGPRGRSESAGRGPGDAPVVTLFKISFCSFRRAIVVSFIFVALYSFAAGFRVLGFEMSYNSARDQMCNDAINGAPAQKSGDASDKFILCRGCDPVMAARSKEFLPPLVGNANMITATDDDTFFKELKQRKYDAVFFAPGACRWSAARQPIPGGNQATRGWSLEQYRAVVREHQGDNVPIVETTKESEIVPLLRRALKLP